jgi:predicted site-specific integrase-resolvase
VSTTPEDGISGAEAAEILGIRELSVSRLVTQGVLTKAVRGQKYGLERTDVERLALKRYRPGHPYWCTSGGAAEILGVSVTRVHQLVDRGFVPAVQHAGRWYFRRHQLEVIANARDARKLRGTLGRD